jgi:hypothetical protein
MTKNDENCPLKDFTAPKVIGIQLGYTVPNIVANIFELKPALLNMISKYMFNGLAHEDPNQHLAIFEELYNTVKINGVEPEAIKLRAFSFFLGDKARNWLRYLDTLSNRRKLDEETVTLTEKISAIVMNRLPSKLQDPDSFIIPCAVGSTKFNRALCDLRANVSLIPKSVFDRIEVGDLVPTKISL